MLVRAECALTDPPTNGASIQAMSPNRYSPRNSPAVRLSLCDGLGVMSLAHLRQLLRIAEQHQIAGRTGHRDRVGKAELACFLDDEQV